MVLGPLDRRALKTRCQACARRRIKCVGSPPCLYCSKKNIECLPQATQSDTKLVFVNTRPSVDPSAPKLPLVLPSNATDAVVARFFTVFLGKNDFAGEYLDLDAIVSSFQANTSLYHAALAIGELDSRSFFSSSAEKRSATTKALTSYHNSITSFNLEIQSKDILKSDAALWTTFFLGLFELMCDVTGTGWVKHMLYGTSSILQARGPEAHLYGRGRSFFLTIRPFEICRSLIFSEPSFLSQPEWISVTERLWYGNPAPHPKEELFDLMLSCSALSCRVWEAVKPDVTAFDETLLLDLAAEGCQIRLLLEQWYEMFQERVLSDLQGDSWAVLATAYYHAISIYLSGIFDYRPQFDHFYSASLPLEIIQGHVTGILTNVEFALQTTNLAGIFSFFPLRVAGARVWSAEQQSSVLRMLEEISSRAFVVAGAFVLDLNILWVTKRSREAPGRA